MITTDYVVSAIEQIEGEDEFYLHLTRRFGPLTYETIKDMNIGDEMSIQIAFPGDVSPLADAPASDSDPEQLSLFPENAENEPATTN